jgi:hypothetical protein
VVVSHVRDLARSIVAPAAIALLVMSQASAESPSEPFDANELPYLATVERFLLCIEKADVGTAVETLGWSDEAAAKIMKPLAEVVSIGPHDGHELVAVRRISPRIHQIFGVIHYAQKPVLFTLHLRQFKGAWRIQIVNFSDDLTPLDASAPLEPVAATKQEKVAVDLH